jgi:predicted nucleic acid-binding protein
MVYVDSSVFIYPVIYQTESQQKAKRAKEILLKIESGGTISIDFDVDVE